MNVSQNQSIELAVEVLTNGNWPMSDYPLCVIPAQLKSCIDRFEMYYHNKHQNRKLQWMYQFGQVELHPTYIVERNYQLVVNVFQASILSLFNETSKLTYKEIAEKTTIPKKNLDAALIALCKPGI
jgi:cullin 4